MKSMIQLIPYQITKGIFRELEVCMGPQKDRLDKAIKQKEKEQSWCSRLETLTKLY